MTLPNMPAGKPDVQVSRLPYLRLAMPTLILMRLLQLVDPHDGIDAFVAAAAPLRRGRRVFHGSSTTKAARSIRSSPTLATSS